VDFLGYHGHYHRHYKKTHWTDMDDVSKACSLLLHYACVVSCKGIASAPEQDSTAAHSASVKELVQITTLNNLDHFVLTGQL